MHSEDFRLNSGTFWKLCPIFQALLPGISSHFFTIISMSLRMLPNFPLRGIAAHMLSVFCGIETEPGMAVDGCVWVKMRGEVFGRQDDKSSWLSLLIILNTSDNYSTTFLCVMLMTDVHALHLVWQKMSTNDFLTDITNMWQFLLFDRWIAKDAPPPHPHSSPEKKALPQLAGGQTANSGNYTILALFLASS